jgi:hypothetical protein
VNRRKHNLSYDSKVHGSIIVSPAKQVERKGKAKYGNVSEFTDHKSPKIKKTHVARK